MIKSQSYATLGQNLKLSQILKLGQKCKLKTFIANFRNILGSNFNICLNFTFFFSQFFVAISMKTNETGTKNEIGTKKIKLTQKIKLGQKMKLGQNWNCTNNVPEICYKKPHFFYFPVIFKYRSSDRNRKKRNMWNFGLYSNSFIMS